MVAVIAITVLTVAVWILVVFLIEANKYVKRAKQYEDSQLRRIDELETTLQDVRSDRSRIKRMILSRDNRIDELEECAANNEELFESVKDIARSIAEARHTSEAQHLTFDSAATTTKEGEFKSFNNTLSRIMLYKHVNKEMKSRGITYRDILLKGSLDSILAIRLKMQFIADYEFAEEMRNRLSINADAYTKLVEELSLYEWDTCRTDSINTGADTDNNGDAKTETSAEYNKESEAN